MKKNLLFILTAVLLLITAPRVHAESSNMSGNTTGNTNTNVVVGNVATNTTQSVYVVGVSWEGMVFDWTYDSSENDYSWKATDTKTHYGLKYESSNPFYSSKANPKLYDENH